MGLQDSSGNHLILDMLALSSDGNCIIDAEGEVCYRNKAFDDIFSGLSVQDSSFHLNNIFQVEDCLRFKKMLAEARSRDEVFLFTGTGDNGASFTLRLKPLREFSSDGEYFLCSVQSGDSHRVPLQKMNQLLALYNWQEDSHLAGCTESRVIDLIREMTGTKAAYWCPYDKIHNHYIFSGKKSDKRLDFEDEMWWFTLPIRNTSHPSG